MVPFIQPIAEELVARGEVIAAGTVMPALGARLMCPSGEDGEPNAPAEEGPLL